MGQLFNLAYTCLNNMFYNRNIGFKTRDGLFTHLQADPTTRRLVSTSMERASGILMPISSLPGPYGIGSFGWNAYEESEIRLLIQGASWG